MSPSRRSLAPDLDLGWVAAERAAPPASCALSLVVPAYDEEPNLLLLYERVQAVLGSQSDWELVLIDDGSRDGTARVIRELARRDARVVGVFLARNCGQSAALAAGAREARGSD